MSTQQPSWVEVRRQLHQIPEPGFAEFKTQALLLQYIQSLPSDRVIVRTWKTGILVKVPGQCPAKTIGYRADMDGLPIPEETTVDFQSQHPGYMHACGHDMHMTIGLAILTHFVHHPMDDDLVVVFQPAEEGPGGARPMLESAEFQAWRPDCMLALHISPEHPVGTIATKPGILFANTSELFIDLVGTGGHAAFPHKANDMVVAAAHLVTQLQSIVSRNVNPLESAVITIGKIEGGTRQNIIAERARLEGTIRSFTMDVMHHVKSRIESMVRGLEVAFACQATIDYGANYQQVWNDPDLTNEFMAWLQESQTAQLEVCSEAMTGEDFGYFLGEIPGFMFWLGVETPYGLHHAKLEPNEQAIQVAVDVVTKYIVKISGL